MRTFDEIGEGKCEICKTSDPGRVTLIPKDGTADGNIEEAVIVHVDCLSLRYNPSVKIFYQKVEGV